MSDINHLFVYGTLLSGDTGATGHAQRQRLAREASIVGSGTTPGQLYDLGRYPGLVLPADDNERVHGEVLELPGPERTLRWLDAYEGIIPGQHRHNDYERLQVSVALDDGGVAMAWTYVYRAAVNPARRIAGGSWLLR